MRYVLFAILVLPVLVLAQESQELMVGDRVVGYDLVVENEAGQLYYKGEVLVASEKEGVILVYENDLPILEAYDLNGDGMLDAFVTLDANEDMVEVSGEEVAALARPEVVEFSELVAEGGGGEAAAPEAEEDLVGSLDSITIPGANPWFWPVFLLAAVLAGWWYFKGRKADDDD